jgi:hypothetical protein
MKNISGSLGGRNRNTQKHWRKSIGRWKSWMHLLESTTFLQQLETIRAQLLNEVTMGKRSQLLIMMRMAATSLG